MNETLFAIYFVVWLALAVGSYFLFRGRDPAFKRRWYARATAFNGFVIGGMILILLTTFPSFSWPVFGVFAVGLLFIMWVAVFRTRVCPGCGKVCQPENLITPQSYCSKCGTSLAAPDSP